MRSDVTATPPALPEAAQWAGREGLFAREGAGGGPPCPKAFTVLFPPSVHLQRIWTRLEKTKKRALQSPLLSPTLPPAPPSSWRKEVDVLKSTCYHKLPPEPPEPASGDDSDAATFTPTLPDLSPEEPSEALCFPTLEEEEEEEEEEGLCEAGGPPRPTRSPSAAIPEPVTARAADEAASPAAEEGAAVDPGSDGSPGKSPSKKKKKFRTPSFLKKSKKRSDS
ncbi:alpha-adducin-like [Physeter macrocephalus]|uniref:Alpha-adducin-like n=1 Tax=Physeter macrocephalus TaxID=9755 RepID=A0A455B0I9_PHYMC|nr:alpha-adducin-like [Physeter catodon]|eukprot:XP_028342410.1 alpha-adducin-like [Physeter catodon]